MSGYDTVHTGFRHGQVKAWGCGLRDLGPGDPVELTTGPETTSYSVATTTGGWVNVADGRIVSITDTAERSPRLTTTGYATGALPPPGPRRPDRRAAMLAAVFGTDLADPDDPADDTTGDPADELCGPVATCPECARLRRS